MVKFIPLVFAERGHEDRLVSVTDGIGRISNKQRKSNRTTYLEDS